ncbi:MAG: IS1 family transposase [Planctomycetes bacterium]|nr:IS1 family transposase [Planctomycetota bacterium]
MIAPTCKHERKTGKGKDRNGFQRYKCKDCGVSWTDRPAKPLGDMRVDLAKAKLALRMLVEGMSIRATERTAGINRNTICKLVVLFGTACRKFLDDRMHGLKLTHLQFDEQWTWVAKKNSRLTVDEKRERHDIGDQFIWTCVDEQTKLMPSFLIGKRSADNARRFMMDVSKRLARPAPHASDAHGFAKGGYRPIVRISTDGFPGYPEAVDLAFGPHAKYGVIIKEYRNANMIYTPSEMVGTKRTGIRGIEGRAQRSIGTSHVERLNGTQRVFMKRLNRLTLCFSKKLENLEAAFAMFAAYYNYCWQTRHADNSGKAGTKRPSAAMMAKLAGHVWSFDELFDEVLAVRSG